jgi:Spy/CpxP family protein refolding chaperone
MKRSFRHLLLALALLVPSAAFADAAPNRTPADKRAQVEARMRQIRADILQKDVGLDAEKTRVVQALLERHSAERKRIETALHAERRTLDQLLEADSKDQAAYAKSITALRARHAELSALRQRELDELGRHLTPKQQAKFLSALRRVQKKLRSLLKSYPASDP